MSVEYDRQTFNHPSPISRFAHRSRLKKSLETVAALAPHGGKVLDFGAGGFDFLEALADWRDDLELFGYEPYMASSAPERVTRLADLAECRSRKFDCIVCLETVEHLSDADLEGFIALCRDAVGEGGSVLVTSPVMLGPVLLLKEASRSILFRRRSEYSFREMVMAAFLGVSPKRPEDRGPTHKGYDFRETYRHIREGLPGMRSQTRFGPFGWLPYFCNSQAYLVMTP